MNLTGKLLLSAPLVVAIAVSALGLPACDTETPTTASLKNDYPEVADGGDPALRRIVYKAWYASTLFLEPVAPGETSGEQRTVPSTDYVYALLAIGWDPASGTPPGRVVPLRSKAQLAVSRGNLGLIQVSPARFYGDCTAGTALSQEDADFITERIFPGAFSGLKYDAATCTSTSVPVDGGGGDATPE